MKVIQIIPTPGLVAKTRTGRRVAVTCAALCDDNCLRLMTALDEGALGFIKEELGALDWEE